MEILGDDAGVPRATGGGDHAGDEVGKDSGENQKRQRSQELK